MDSFNNGGFSSLSSIKPSIKVSGGKKSNNENELSPEMASRLKSPSKKQLPTKNFMSPTISAANKAFVPKKKILGDRNETLDVTEQTSLLTPPVLGSKPVKSSVVDAADDNVLQPYDPITNYLSPRPKYLRYNPNRRRNIVLQGNEDCVKNCCACDSGNGVLPSSELELGLGSSISTDSCSQKESAEEEEDVINKEGDDGDETEEEEEEEEEMVEFVEDGYCSLKGLLKVLLVLIALTLTTRAICWINSPTTLQTIDSVWGFNDKAKGLNFSKGVYDLVKEPDLLVGRLKQGDLCHDYEGLNMIETIEDLVDDGVHQDETNAIHIEKFQENEVAVSEVMENNNVEAEIETEEIHIERFQEHGVVASEVMETNDADADIEVDDFNQDEDEEDEGVENDEKDDAVQDEILQVHEIAASKVDNVEDEVEAHDINQDGLIKESDSDAERDIDDIKSTSLDPIHAVIIGFSLLILTPFGVIIFWSKQTKSTSSTPVPTTMAKENNAAEEQEIKNVLQPTLYPSSLIQNMDDTQQLVNKQKHVSKEISLMIHAPSVELLGEFVFGEELSTNVSTNTVSSSQTKYSYMEMSTGDSYTVKKQRRKNAEASSMVTPSSVRRSSRLQSKSIKSP